MAITYEIKGERLGEVIARKQAGLLRALVGKMAEYMFALQQKARSIAPVGHDVETPPPGTLRESIRNPRAELEGDHIVGTLDVGGEPTTVKTYAGQTYDYARIIMEGSTEHEVPVSRKRALHFLLGGKEVFAHFAVVSGVTANPFMADALMEMRSEIINGLQETIGISLRE